MKRKKEKKKDNLLYPASQTSLIMQIKQNFKIYKIVTDKTKHTTSVNKIYMCVCVQLKKMQSCPLSSTSFA